MFNASGDIDLDGVRGRWGDGEIGGKRKFYIRLQLGISTLAKMRFV